MKILLRAGGDRLQLLDTELTTEIVKRFETQLDSDGAVPFAINLSCRSWGKDAIKVFLDLVEKRNIAKTTETLILDDILLTTLHNNYYYIYKNLLFLVMAHRWL